MAYSPAANQFHYFHRNRPSSCVLLGSIQGTSSVVESAELPWSTDPAAANMDGPEALPSPAKSTATPRAVALAVLPPEISIDSPVKSWPMDAQMAALGFGPMPRFSTDPRDSMSALPADIKCVPVWLSGYPCMRKHANTVATRWSVDSTRAPLLHACEIRSPMSQFALSSIPVPRACS